MPNLPIRFRRGQGLEISAASKTQQGLLEAQNVDLELRDVLQKRPGFVESLLVDKDDEPPTAPVACWYRGDELAVEGQNDLYVRRECEHGAPTWDVRGPWTRTRARVMTAHDSGREPMRQAGAVLVDDGVDRCTVVISESGAEGGQVRVDVVADTGERWRLGTLDLPITDALVFGQGAAKAGITGSDAGNKLQLYEWQPGVDLDTVSPITVDVMGAAHLYDSDGARGSLGDYSAHIVVDSVGQLRVRVRWNFGGGTINVNQAIPAPMTNMDAVAIHATEDPGYAGARVAIAVAGRDAGGNAVAWVRVRSYLASTGAQDGADTVSAIYTVSTTPPNVVNAVAVGMLPTAIRPARDIAEVRVEVVQQGAGADLPMVQSNRIQSIFVSSSQLWRRTSIYSSMEICRQQLVGLLSSVELGDDATAPTPNTPGYADANRRLRSGLFLTALRIVPNDPGPGVTASSEVVGRAASLQGELYTSVLSLNLRTTRQVQRMTLTGDELVTGYARERDEPDTRTLAQVLNWDVSERPDDPAQLGGVVVAAMGGYPRLYDGLVTAEHDWHELPILVALTPTAGGGNTKAGSYGIAITWRWTDARGQVYESAPSFDLATGIAGGKINVRWRNLVQTEHGGQLVIWRTVVDGSVYYEDTVLDAVLDTGGLPDEENVDLTIDDLELERNRQLDQVVGGRLVSVPNDVTDWIAESGGRLWAPDPWRGDLVRYTTPIAEGAAPSWTLVQGTTTPTGERATALRELDGRVVVFTGATISYTAGDGPGATGAGAYPALARLAAEQGARDQSVVVEVPQGLLFGVPEGAPLLLSRGLGTVALFEPVSALFDTVGNVARVMVYERRRGTVHAASDTEAGGTGRTLRLHVESGRFAEDVGNEAKDYAVGQRGELALVHRDGRVLIQSATTWTDGGEPYETRISTPWVHEPARDGLIHGGMQVMGVTVAGAWLGLHDLDFEVYFDYESIPRYTPSLAGATLQTRELAGRPYLYRAEWAGAHCHSARIVVSDGSATSAGFRLEGMDVTYDTDGSPAEIGLDSDAIAME